MEETTLITYNWNCKTVDVYPKNGDLTQVVHNVHWIVTGTVTGSEDTETPETPIESTVYGTQILNTTNIVDFTPFDQLTNEQIVTWTKSAMGEERVLEIETTILNQIELLKNPVSITVSIT